MVPRLLGLFRASASLSLLAAAPAFAGQVVVEPIRAPSAVVSRPWARPRPYTLAAPYSRAALTPVLQAPALSPRVLSAPSVAAPAAFAPYAAPAVEASPVVAERQQAAPAVSVLDSGLEVQEALSRKDASDSKILSGFYEGNRRSGPAVDLSGAQTPAASGAELLAELHKTSGRGHRTQEYKDASHYMFGTSDNVLVNGVRGVIDAYSGIFVPGTSPRGDDYPEKGDPNHDGWVDREGMNVEHTWPQSFFDRALPMRSDLHHLLPTFHHPNSIRSNLPFGEVKGKPEYSNNAGAKMGGGVFEPPDAVKGKVARAVLYFYTRYYDRNITQGAYNNGFFKDRVEMFLRWNREHPPTADELRRNDLVEKYQGNRNPFVDNPALADRIGVQGFGGRPIIRGTSSLQGREFRPQPNQGGRRHGHGKRRHGGRAHAPVPVPHLSYSLN